MESVKANVITSGSTTVRIDGSSYKLKDPTDQGGSRQHARGVAGRTKRRPPGRVHGHRVGGLRGPLRAHRPHRRAVRQCVARRRPAARSPWASNAPVRRAAVRRRVAVPRSLKNIRRLLLLMAELNAAAPALHANRPDRTFMRNRRCLLMMCQTSRSRRGLAETPSR